MIDYIMTASVGALGAGLIGMERLAAWRWGVRQRRQQQREEVECLRAISESGMDDGDSASPRQPQTGTTSSDRVAPKARVPRLGSMFDSQLSRWA